MPEMSAELIATYDMYCRLCYGYIALRGLGCNAPDGGKPKSCTNCKIVVCEKRTKNGWDICAPCDTPCRRLKDLDKRYRGRYHMSMIENLDTIRIQGMEYFLQQQEEKFRCPVCGEMPCAHREDCPSYKTPVWE